MNRDPHDNPHDLSDALRWQLRSLRQDETPTRDLWAGIAPRLTARAGGGAVDDVGTKKPPASPATWRWRVPVALAASVLVAVGTLGLLRYGGPSPDQPGAGEARLAHETASEFEPTGGPMGEARTTPVSAAHMPVALAEAEGLRLQYEGAFRELEARPGVAAATPTLRTLDHSAELILAALRQAPDSTRLLEQLRRTYQRRLDLMRLPLA